ncbi:hypothetical protein [Aporhodopirellula aestuarii]|uniref:TIGR03067 domain-containing protein n=1 Tax=Aporhodopirellula aestuarii TaxID=2950107 RepID=A0ABT0TXD1_9BACT|nr:hypothetical protein [Aporhodopirellula aestuarii]MCM2369273.1 hypothetical protein [Aporhodopirellula aestuarii]
MFPIKLAVFWVLLATLAISPSSLPAADNLSEILRKHQWDGIVGTWVDAQTKGEISKVTYAWKIEERVIEVTSEGSGLESVSLMGVNARTGEVFHMGADSEGASSLGKWTIDEKGDAVLGLLFTAGDGEQGGLSIRHHREDQDTMIVTLELPEPTTVKMIRVKPAQ